MGSNPDIREDDCFINKAEPINDMDEPDKEADIVSKNNMFNIKDLFIIGTTSFGHLLF